MSREILPLLPEAESPDRNITLPESDPLALPVATLTLPLADELPVDTATSPLRPTPAPELTTTTPETSPAPDTTDKSPLCAPPLAPLLKLRDPVLPFD